jgi:hypothetical protein
VQYLVSLTKGTTWAEVFENGLLRGIFRTKGEEVTGSWRKLHNEELHNLYSSPNIIKVIKSRSTRWAEHIESIGEMRNTYKVLMGKLDGNEPWHK